MALFQQSGGTADDRRCEADRILSNGLETAVDSMEPREREFVIGCEGDRPISPKMLFWLRDLYGKYCL